MTVKKCKIATKSATWITMKKLFKLTETKLKLNIFLNNKNWNKQIWILTQTKLNRKLKCNTKEKLIMKMQNRIIYGLVKIYTWLENLKPRICVLG